MLNRSIRMLLCLVAIAAVVTSGLLACGARNSLLKSGSDQGDADPYRLDVEALPMRAGEEFKLRLKLTANRPMRVVKLDRVYAYGVLRASVIGPNGERVPGGPPTIRPRSDIDPADIVELQAGESVEGTVSLATFAPQPGTYTIDVRYAPVPRDNYVSRSVRVAVE